MLLTSRSARYVSNINKNMLKARRSSELISLWNDYNKAFAYDSDAELVEALRVIDNKLTKLLNKENSSAQHTN